LPKNLLKRKGLMLPKFGDGGVTRAPMASDEVLVTRWRSGAIRHPYGRAVSSQAGQSFDAREIKVVNDAMAADPNATRSQPHMDALMQEGHVPGERKPHAANADAKVTAGVKPTLAEYHAAGR